MEEFFFGMNKIIIWFWRLQMLQASLSRRERTETLSVIKSEVNVGDDKSHVIGNLFPQLST